MPRIRTIKPEFWDDEKLAKMPFEVRLFFIALWNFSDDYGIVKASPVWLKAKIFPYDESLKTDKVKGWLDILINAGMLIPVEWEKEGFLYIRSFNDHQVINRPGKPVIPKKDLELLLSEYSVKVPTPVIDDSSGKGKEGKGMEGGKHPFSKSPYYDFNLFKEPLLKKGWSIEKIKLYYEKAEGYSKANGGRYLDWLAAVQNWERAETKKQTPTKPLIVSDKIYR